MSNDKWDATSHDPQALPPREPYASFAQHGAPPEKPHPHAPVSPGPAPWATYQAPARKSRAWIWVLVAVAALLMCGFGIVAVSVGGTAVVDEIDRQVSDRRADIKITSCKGDRFGLVTIAYTVHNSSDIAQSYLPGFNVQSKTGTIYGQTADIVNDLPAGKDYQGSAIASIGEGHKDLVCTLTGA